MPLFYKNGKTLLFIHIPKTGGTSIEFFFRHNGFAVKWLTSTFSVTRRESSPQHRHREKILEFLQKQSVSYDVSFTVVRDPLDRLLSEYFQQCRNGGFLSRRLTFLGLPPKRLTPWRAVNQAFASWGFAYWVDRVFELHRRNPAYFDNHIRPQVEFLLDDTKVFRYEDGFQGLFDFLKALDREYGFQMDFGKFVHYTKGSNRVPITISSRTIDKIFQFYKEDYERFYPDVLVAWRKGNL